jgi:hypothetical protein
MEFKVGLENNPHDRSIAWVLAHPGCFTYGTNGDEAMHNVPAAIRDYAEWIKQHESHPWLSAETLEWRVDETFEDYTINDEYDRSSDGYEVESFFLYDWKPLTDEDIQHSLKLLSWSRDDLLMTVGVQQQTKTGLIVDYSALPLRISQEKLDQSYPGERWSIAGILNHIGGAEWWYMDRLGLAFPQAEVPKNPFERLAKVRAYLLAVLPTLVNVQKVVGIDGEFWSPRKMLRRAVWHERDHTTHIRKLL